MTTEERLAALERAVTKLAANKVDLTTLESFMNLQVSRYADLHTAYVNLSSDVSAIQSWVTNHLTGNNV